MSGSHKKLPGLFWIQLALVGIVGLLFIYYQFNSPSGGHEAAEASKQTLKPIGEVALASDAAQATAGQGRSGKEIVDKTCQTCHANGVANAPRLDASGKAAWEERYAKGLDAMIQTAKTGKGAMPPMGTDPTLSDAELKSAIIYMLEKAGISVAGGDSSTATTATPEASATTGTAADSGQSTPTEAVATAANSTAQSTTDSPAAPAAPQAPEPPAVAEPAPATVTNATNAPATAPEPAAPAAPEAAAAPQAPEPQATAPAPAEPAPASAPAEPEQASAPEAPAEPQVAAAAAAPESAARQGTGIDGEKLYRKGCFSCHDLAVAGAPKPGDSAAWAPRIAQGMDALYESAIKGKGAMPPRGGFMELSDDEIKAIVDYLVSQVK